MLARLPSRTATYLDAIEKLTPLVAEHRASFDRDRRLPDAIFRALAEAGLFRLWLPAAMGGPELSPAEFMRVVEAASAKDGSIGWIVANGGGMSRVAGYLPESVVREWFDDPCAFIVSATGAVGLLNLLRAAIASPDAGRSAAGPAMAPDSWDWPPCATAPTMASRRSAVTSRANT